MIFKFIFSKYLILSNSSSYFPINLGVKQILSLTCIGLDLIVNSIDGSPSQILIMIGIGKIKKD